MDPLPENRVTVVTTEPDFLQKQVKPRPSHLRRFGQGHFAGGVLTPPLTKGVYNPFGNPVQGDCIPLTPLAIHPRHKWRGILAGFHKPADSGVMRKGFKKVPI